MILIPKLSGRDPNVAAPILDCIQLTFITRRRFKATVMDPLPPQLLLILLWPRPHYLQLALLGPFLRTPTLTIRLRRWEALLSLPVRRAFSNRSVSKMHVSSLL